MIASPTTSLPAISSPASGAGHPILPGDARGQRVIRWIQTVLAGLPRRRAVPGAARETAPPPPDRPAPRRLWPQDQALWIGENGLYRRPAARQALVALSAGGACGAFTAWDEGRGRIVTGPASAVVLADAAAEIDCVGLLTAIGHGDAF